MVFEKEKSRVLGKAILLSFYSSRALKIYQKQFELSDLNGYLSEELKIGLITLKSRIMEHR